MKKIRLIKKAAIILLSFILVFSNSIVLHADEVNPVEETDPADPLEPSDPADDQGDGNPDGVTPEGESGEVPESVPEENPDSSGASQDDEEQKRQEEEQKRQEEEQKRQEEEQKRQEEEQNPPEEEQNPQEEEQKKQEEEQKKQEEEQKKQEEEQKKQEEERKKQEEEQKKQEEEQKKQEEEQKVTKITVDNDVISFGTIKAGESPRPVSFVINNAGNTEVSIGWSQTDSTGAFILNMPSNVSIPLKAGSSLQGSVETTGKDLAPGDYSTTLVFTDLNGHEAKATINVSLRVEKAGPVINKVKIRPGSVDVRQGDEAEFTADVEGENDPDTSVTWKVQGNSSSDTWISDGGTLHISNDETASSLTVVAVSKQNENFKDTASAYISKGKYIVNAFVEPSDAGYVNGKGSFTGGERTTLTAVAEKGYRFKEWKDSDNNHVSDSASFTTDKITSDLTYKAVFTQSEYEIKVKSSNKDMGTVKGGGYVDSGDSVVIEAIPNDGYDFEGWYEKDKLVSEDKKLKIKDVKKSHVFVAEFKKNKYVVTVSAAPSEGGKVSGGGNYKGGDEVNLNATPSKGYLFKGYVLNNQVISTSTSYKIKKLDRDLSILAYFEKEGAVNHTIKSGVANSGGVILPSGEISIADGSSITYSIAPDNGYGILMVSVDGKQIGAYSSFTFENIREDHTISVAFAPKENSVNNVKMSKIISVKEADAIAVAKLKKAKADEEKIVSKVITPEMFLAMQEEEAKEKEGDTETIVVPQEQNLVGMDDTENLEDVVKEYNPDTAVGVYQSLDITKETAEKLIDSGGDAILLNEAYELGYLDVLINNEYVTPGKEGEIQGLENDTTVKNLQEVIKSCLTREEKLMMMEGKEIVFSFTISGAENPGEFEKEAMKGAKGVSVDRYLYMTLIKSVDGVPSLVEELETPMQITLLIPEDLREKDKNSKFCIIRNHNGEVDVLEDMDDDPDTVTIMTDRFSPYAIGHFSGENNRIIFIVFFAGIALTILTVFTYINMKDRKKRRKA